MPFPDIDTSLMQIMNGGNNKLISDELRYDKRILTAEHEVYVQQLTNEQKRAYEEVMTAVNSGQGGVFFLYGYGGTGKIFLWKTLAATIRSKGQIVLTVASSGIASLLLPGGRTAHSRFAIPLNLDEFSTYNIKQNTPLAELIIRAKLIVWDEAPMINKLCIEALDRTMRDILRFNNVASLEQPFGGKTVVFDGDFRQILPVIPKGSRQEIVNATINSSYIWDSCKLLTLTRNMRLQADNNNCENNDLREFSYWILSIGDGRCRSSIDGIDKIKIPDDILIHDWDDPVSSICKATYPELFCGSSCVSHVKDKAILAPTLQLVDEINNYMMSLNPSEARTYYSSDTVSESETNNDILASIFTHQSS